MIKRFWNDYGRDLTTAYLIMALNVAGWWLYIDYAMLEAWS